MARVVLDSVTKVFAGGVVALDHVSLDVADGELMTIVGPSGCGKTTLLRLIAGLETQGTGRIEIGGAVVNDVPPKDRDVAMVFQNYALYPHLTVYQNMAFGLKFGRCPKPEIDHRVREAAGTLGISDLLDRKPAALSGGQRQRVALGRAMVQRPRVFLFDEPLSNLDPQSRICARREIRSLHRTWRTTTLYVTHDQSEAMMLGDRVAVICASAIRQVGRPLEVFNCPADRFVAGFIGTPPMNFFEGTIRINGHGIMFVAGDGEIPLPAELAGLANAADGEELTLGIRPRDLRYELSGGGNGIQWLGRVDAIETPGDRLDMHVRTRSGTEFTVSADPHSCPSVGDLVRVTPDSSGIRIFRKGLLGQNVACENLTGSKCQAQDARPQNDVRTRADMQTCGGPTNGERS
jgi:multiple sugar transport system ATP-binding protein